MFREFQLVTIGLDIYIMSTVSVVYVSNDDVGNHIKPIGATKKKTSGIARKKANELSSMFATLSTSTELPSRSTKEKNSKPAVELTEDMLSIAGPVELTKGDDGSKAAQVYSFKTPKSKKHMAKYAAESVKKIRNCYTQTQENQVEKKKMKESQDQLVDEISDEKRHSTRYHFRARSNLNRSDSNSDLDESGSDQFDSEDELASSLLPRMDPKVIQATSGTLPSHRLQLPSERELYFDSHAAGRLAATAQTSDRTLQRLKNPRMAQDKVNEVLAQLESESTDEHYCLNEHKMRLQESYETHFKKWMFSLCNGFNLLLFGLGSKRKLLHSFCDRMLQEHTKLVVNGFFPGLSIKSILESIVEDVLKLDSGFSNVESQIDSISQHYSSYTSDPLFLIIHNIDGMTLRSPRAQNALSRLAALPRIHLIASIDHINAPLIWDQTKLSRFSWLWFDVTTYAPYVEETSHEGSLLLTSGGACLGARGAALALSGLMHVARSLTANARGVFRILVEHHIEKEEGGDEDKGSEDLSFSDLYQKCRERFLVNSELTLRAHLTEFLDHKLLQIRKGIDGCEYLSVPLDTATLKEYLEQEEFS